MVKSRQFPLVQANGMLWCTILFSSPSNLTKQIFLIHFRRGHRDPEKLSNFPTVTELVSEEPGLGLSPVWPPCPSFYHCVDPLPNPPKKDLWDQSQHSFLKKRKCFGIFLGEKRGSEEERKDVNHNSTGIYPPLVLCSHTVLSPEDPRSPRVHTQHFPREAWVTGTQQHASDNR